MTRKHEHPLCPLCQEHHSDTNCASALGRAIGRVKGSATRKANKLARASWVCPPMPMPEPIAVQVADVVVVLPPVPLYIDPPLTPEEAARAAVFVLSGKLTDVVAALQAVRATPCPTDEET